MRLLQSICIVLAATCPATLIAARDALYDGKDGVSCEFFNSGGRLSWKNRGGDWLGPGGVEQGTFPYSTTEVDSRLGNETITLDATALVNDLLAIGARRIQIMIQTGSLDGKTTAAIKTRESPDASARPRISIDAGTQAFSGFAVADAEINCTTYQALGERLAMTLGANTPVVMEFPMPALNGAKRIASATLRFVTTDRRFGRVQFRMFRVDTPVNEWSDAPRTGLGTKYPNDRGLEKDPSVMLVSRFDSSSTWRRQWSYVDDRAEFDTIDVDRDLGFEPLQGGAVRVKLAKGKKLGLNVLYNFRDHPDGEPEEIYFRYYLRFANDWNPTVSGGKLPGIAGTYNKGGWGGRKSDGTNGWSMRGSFEPAPALANPVSGSTPIGTYAYYASMDGSYGDPWHWDKRGLGLLAKNRWYCIEQQVKLNTPGKPNGVMRAWIDGRLAFERTDVLYRTVPELKVEQIWLNVYHGGTEVSPHDQHLFIDNAVIAKQYIGPTKVGP